MNDFSLVEKLNILMETISSSSLFLIFSIISAIILIFVIVLLILNKKINKYIFIGLFCLIFVILFINYGSLILSILNSIIDSIFMMLYFPSIPIYITVVVISNIILIVSILKKFDKIKRIINVITTITLDLFLVLVVEIISRNNIDIAQEINLYTNSSLLVLLELSMGIFVSYVLANLFINAHAKLKKYDKKELPPMPEIIFEDF